MRVEIDGRDSGERERGKGRAAAKSPESNLGHYDNNMWYALYQMSYCSALLLFVYWIPISFHKMWLLVFLESMETSTHSDRA